MSISNNSGLSLHLLDVLSAEYEHLFPESKHNLLRAELKSSDVESSFVFKTSRTEKYSKDNVVKTEKVSNSEFQHEIVDEERNLGPDDQEFIAKELVFKIEHAAKITNIESGNDTVARTSDEGLMSNFELLRFTRLHKYYENAKQLFTINLVENNPTDSIELQLLQIAFKDWSKDKKMALTEEWMADAPLSPYTRGLLIQYTKNHPGENWEDLPYLKKISIGRGNFDRYDAIYTLINRLILEEVYGDYLVKFNETQLRNLYEKIYRRKTSAICLSGGGIRSGTFALGVLQGLSRTIAVDGRPILERFNYMSTVSGGGYIGGWLSSWIHHDGLEKVMDALSNKDLNSAEPDPISRLRQYSNYMTPSAGLFSADTWTIFAIYLRNLMLNWLILVPFLAALVTIPWFVVASANQQLDYKLIIFGIFAGAALMIYSDFFTKKNPPQLQKTASKNISSISNEKRNQPKFLLQCLLPGASAILLWTLCWYWFINGKFSIENPRVVWFQDIFKHGASSGQWKPIIIVCGFTGAFVLIEWFIFLFLEIGLRKIPRRYVEGGLKTRLKDLFFLLFSGTLSGAIFVAVAKILPSTESRGEQAIIYCCFAFPAFVITLLAIGYLYEGLKSKIAEDGEREWASRYSGWFLLTALVWLALSLLILYIPVLAERYIHIFITSGSITGFLTAYLGRKSTETVTPGKKASNDKIKGQGVTTTSLSTVAFMAFIIFVSCLSFMDIALISAMTKIHDQHYLNSKATAIAQVLPFYPLGLFMLAGLLSFYFSKKIDSNRFSLHAMYRSRLIRGFLGAARPQGVRRPDLFTGFDESDNIYIGNLALEQNKPGSAAAQKKNQPFHIVNIALNLVAGTNLAWQERKATSFTVSPLHAGSSYLGYRKVFIAGSQIRPTPKTNSDYYGGDRGISLGTAMTISGAAVSPNSGYSSLALVTFFMTLFNLRLGSWLGNPGPAGDSTFNRSSPSKLVNPIFDEMFGLTNDQKEYVFLSDGGHFDNLGLYEMTLRRTRFIVLIDASCDEACELEDLGNAIRKIRIDQGVEIDFPLKFSINSRFGTKTDDDQYWALGRIRYPENQPASESVSLQHSKNYGDKDGVLLYVKPGIYGGEPKDIFNYATVNKAFPHESTADQFFSESQFESYRALGLHVLSSIIEGLKSYNISLDDLHQSMPGADWKIDVLNKLNAKIA